MHTTARELVRPRRLIPLTHQSARLTSGRARVGAVVGTVLGLVAPLVPAVVIALAPPAQAAGRTVSHAFFGLHDGSMRAYGRIEFGSLRLWDSHTTWKDLETSPGTYDWSTLDSYVAQAQAHHVKVMLVLGMTPSFYAASASTPPTDLSRYRAYVRAVMERYRSFDGRRGIESYQVWNEGNVSMFWSSTPHRLAELTRVVDQVRNRVDPGAKVVAPSFATRLRSQRRWISSYQRQHLGRRPVWRFYDVNALSLYPKERGGPEDAVTQLAWVRARLARAGVPARTPIWATEINFGLPSGDPAQQAASPISPRRQVANVLRTYILGAARGLGRIYWYRYDWGRIAGGGTLGNTLLSDPDDPTQVTRAGRALAVAEHWLDGRLVATGGHARPCARDRRGTYICSVRHGARTRTIMWNPDRRVRMRVSPTSPRLAARSEVVRVGYRPVAVDLPR